MLSFSNAYMLPHAASETRTAGGRKDSDQRLRVLVLTAYRWPTTTRMAHALSGTGAEVEALCPAGHTLMRANCVARTYRYDPLTPLRSLRRAITKSKPNLIIPTDDLIAANVHKLFHLTNADDFAGDSLRSLIARSLGGWKDYSTFYVRSEIARLAQTAEVFTPPVRTIASCSDLLNQLRILGYPSVLKTDGSSGGAGVAIVHNELEAKRAFTRLSGSPNFLLTLKRLIVDGDANLVLPCLRRVQPDVSIQPYVAGRLANIAVACWEGSVLGQVCVEVLSSNGETGPATVVRIISHAGMSQAAEKMVGLLKLSGLCGFDFILDSENAAHLIDFNPRATQTCHLMPPDAKQPLASLISKLGGPQISEAYKTPHDGPIVLFPQGFLSEKDGPYSEHASKDLPAESTEFVTFGLEYRRKRSRLLVRAIRNLSKKLGGGSSRK